MPEPPFDNWMGKRTRRAEARLRYIASGKWFKERFVILAIAWSVAWFIHGIDTGSWEGFGRSGSFLAFSGAFIAALDIWRVASHADVPTRRFMRDTSNSRIGTVLALIGTLIWGYGDALGCSLATDSCFWQNSFLVR